MSKLNIHQAKTQLSRHLKNLKKGKRIVLCRRNVPIAEILPLPQVRKKKRPLGLDRNRIKVPSTFFDPLPDDILETFEESPDKP
jgi:antitoxin (DNA-binding transcriptional repressor) of toxin-antitoxin stability system